MRSQDVVIVGFVLLVVLALMGGLNVGGCHGHKKDDPSCPDCEPEKRGPRPHSLLVEERHAGKPIACHCGDVVRVKLPCCWLGGCFRPASTGIPHLVREGEEDGGVFRYRVACPGQCRLRFTGPRDVEFAFNVRP